METEKYAIYKGLQRPLIFKSFKGKFIYYAAGAVLAAVVVGGICAAIISSIVGLITLAAVGGGGLMMVLKMQKKGLHNKTRDTAIYIHKPVYKNSGIKKG